MKTLKAYHFLQADMTAGSGDEKAWEIGETRTIADRSRIILCEYGYHSSPSLWDALNYAHGPMACLVEISKPIQTDETTDSRKAVSASRTLIKAVNIDRELRLFACDCAERVLHIYERDDPSKAPRQAIEVARRFANGKATKKELDAARAAAWAAARAAAWDAARAAARDAAWDAAWDAARAAARAATRDAAVQWQRQHFEEMFGGIFK
jgi:hypothetical protein